MNALMNGEHTSYARLISFGLALCLLALCFIDLGRADAQPGSDYVHHRRLTVEGPDGEQQTVALIFPRRVDRAMAPPEGRYALIVALHDLRGVERGPQRAAMVFSVNFTVPLTFGAFERGRLTRRDFSGFVTDSHLELVNAELATGGFEPPVIVSPYVPDLSSASPKEFDRYAEWITSTLLPNVREAYPGVSQERSGTGIDGIEMGGRVALEVGLRAKDAFASVGAIQPLLDSRAAADLAARVDPKTPQYIRLMTSEEDPGRGDVLELSRALRSREIPHDLLDTPGTRDIEYGRGPGSIELLRFHTRVLERDVIEP